MKTETIEELKQAMGYVGETECCSCCKNFRNATDGNYFGGQQTEPKSDRCGLNVIEVPVCSGGRCNHFDKTEPLIRVGKTESL